MLKKISVEQLVVGMHIKEFCGSWIEHPFWRKAFVVSEAKDIEALRASSIREIWIDCAKGLDVAPGQAAITETETEAQVDAELRVAAARSRETAPAATSVEVARATKICAKARGAVSSMFHEARLGKVVNTAGAQRLVSEIFDSVSRNPGALIGLARLKTADDYTYLHSVAVCALMIALAKQLGLDETQIRSAGTAGLLHDLGKVLIPAEVLNKPGKLSVEEFEIVKTHPVEGHKLLLGNTSADAIALDVVLHHHERTDGSGYPEGLTDSAISLFAKMGAVCDVYDAITSDRAYKRGWDPAESLRRMANWAEGRFDSVVFQAFVKSVGIYPIGSLVKLNSGRLGLVVEQGDKSLLTPRIKVFYSTRAQTRIRPEIIDLSRSDCPERIASREDPAKWNFADLNELWSGMPASA